MSTTFKWGILGCGRIARKFAGDIALISNATIHAVASRSQQRADDFAKEQNAPLAFDSYEALAQCGEIDAVYIATRHVHHSKNSILCLKNKVPVLCEKPFAINAHQVKHMIQVAKENDTFLMEAVWTRFLPVTLLMLDTLEKGNLGEIQKVTADFGFKATYDPNSRLFDRALGGGSLLDIGIYPVFLALLLLGKPKEINATALIGSTHVDEDVKIIFKYEGGKSAELYSTIKKDTETDAFIECSNGTIQIPSRWHESKQIIFNQYGEDLKEIELNYPARGYQFEAEAVMEDVRAGRKENAMMPLDFSLDLIGLLDDIRKEIGLVYPEHDI